MQNTLAQKIGHATKWSTITEISAKLVSPVSSMILARLLTPEAFGVVATVNVITSFTDIFTDAGFQKYLIQHEFADDEEKYNSTTVAFWTNLFLSLTLWAIIGIFRDAISTLVGNPDKGSVIVVACVVLPLTSFSSIQMALFKRDFDFKSLFYARIVGVFIPLLITIPCAFIFRNYWALILGNIVKAASDAIILTVRSKWKPSFYYDFHVLKEMFSFSMWTLLEQISIWMTSYIGTFIVGLYLSSYYVGLYKTAMTTVTQFTSLITAAITPVLFSALSRLQTDVVEFKATFLRFQRIVGILIVPISFGIYLYRDTITLVLLGKQWMEASTFIGLWGITSCLGILLNNFCSEAYRALGKPKLSLLVQAIHLIVLVPVLLYYAQQGFEALYWARSLVRFQMYFTQLIALYLLTKISFIQMVNNVKHSMFAGIVMTLFGMLLQTISTNLIWSIISIGLCAIVYFLVLMLFPSFRSEFLPLGRKLLKR